jgi:hypothetical protein
MFFYDAVTIQTKQSRMVGWIMNNQFERKHSLPNPGTTMEFSWRD